MLKTLSLEENRVLLLDQTKLPLEKTYVICDNYQKVAEAIKNMVVRGAPAIGVAAAMGIALGAAHSTATTLDDFKQDLDNICLVFSETRPTAVNLFWAIDRMKSMVAAHRGRSVEELKHLLKETAVKMEEEDIEINHRIGTAGKDLLKSGDRVLTHCNAGALATAGYGTALGVIRAAHEEGKKIEVFACETRPFLQGARLTAWELKESGIPVTVITDGMAGYAMQKKGIGVVITGADCICSNGDVTNKIGTYSLAILAREHQIPFYVAAPLSTVNFSCESGEDVPIEERDRKEVTHIAGQRITPEGVEVWNPAFDITPSKYVSAIITESGVVKSPYQTNLARMKERTTK